MDLKKYFNSINLSEIDRFISERQEENIYLEFKTTVHPNYNNNNREFDKKNISEVISGFANSDGGIVIWGVKAKENNKKQDIAYQKKPIKELTKFLNLLNRLEGQAVTPIVSGIIHKKIEISTDEGFIKTYIPPSDLAPHMANYSNKHYYKRSGDSFYICEHYDIMNLINRKRSPVLKFQISSLKLQKSGQRSGNIYYDLEFNIQIKNESKIIAKYPCLSIVLSNNVIIDRYGIDGNGGTGLKKTLSSGIRATYIGGIDYIIYPDNTIDIDKILLSSFYDSSQISDIIIEYTLVCENMDMIKNRYFINKEELIKCFNDNKITQ